MKSRSSYRLSSVRAAGLVLGLGCLGTAGAAEPVPVYSAAPAAMPAEACPTCSGAPTAAGCKTCGKGCRGILPHARKPYVPHLCPGACFGYFQTQWHRWEDVCPIPYQGVGLTDAPTRPTPGAPAPSLTPQSPAEPKKGSDQPLHKPASLPIPQVPEKLKM